MVTPSGTPREVLFYRSFRAAPLEPFPLSKGQLWYGSGMASVHTGHSIKVLGNPTQPAITYGWGTSLIVSLQRYNETVNIVWHMQSICQLVENVLN